MNGHDIKRFNNEVGDTEKAIYGAVLLFSRHMS